MEGRFSVEREKCKHEDIRTMSVSGSRLRCYDCGKEFKPHTAPNESWKKKRVPKVLVFDTENAPNLASVWGVWNQNLQPVNLLSDWYMLSWSAKWLFDKEVMGDVLTSKEAVAEDDHRLMKGLWKLMDQADVVIAHNAVKFDIPVVNTRFLMNGMTPPSPYQVIDTLRIARKEFNFTHNKLDFLADRLGIPHKKLETEHKLWLNCRNGDQEALEYMLKYNKMDVTVLEELYVKFRPYIKSHPNFNLFMETDGVCATCGSDNLEFAGHYHTTVNKYESHVCKDCGSYTRSTKTKKGVKSGFRSISR